MNWTLAMTLAIGLAGATAAGATDYFLSPGGDDAAAGTREAPWTTIAKANESVKPGDTVTFLAGEYEGCIEPGVSGEEGAPIIYRSDAPLRAALRGGESSDESHACVLLVDRSHIEIAGFHMLPARGRWMKLTSATYCTVLDCVMEKARDWGGVRCEDCHYNRYVGNVVQRGGGVSKWGHTGGNMWNNNNCSHCVFERNHFSRVGHCPLNFMRESPYNIVRGNIFDCRWGRNFEFFSTPRALIEGNIITNGFDGSGSADGRAKLFVIDSIFRRNVIARNAYGALIINSYQYKGFPAPFSMARSRLYQNTWYRNHDCGFEMSDLGKDPDPHYVTGNVFANNIFFDNDPGGGHLSLLLWGNIADDNRWLSNAICGDAPGRKAIRYDTPGDSLATWPGLVMTAEEANAEKPDQFEGNLDVAPMFRDAEADNYRLAAASPCLDAGRPLTRATADGSGRELPVEDARWFFDGFGIPGEQGDLIVIGEAKTAARVVKADIEANLLTLDRDVTWREGDGVTLPFVGDAPDLGAYESGAREAGLPEGPVIPDGLRLLTMETATEPVVVTDFEEHDLEDWFYYWNFSRQRNTDARMDDTTAASGRRSMCVFATDDKAYMSCDIRPRWWDIDRFPTVKLSYRIPEGVPVGMYLYGFRSAEWGRGAVCIGGSPARDVGGYTDLERYELIADDQWHEVTIDARVIREVFPEIKLLKMFRFWTNSSGTKDQQYWFDNFRILPAENL